MSKQSIIDIALYKLNSSGYLLDCDLENFHVEFINVKELIPLLKQAGYSGNILVDSDFFPECNGYGPILWLYDPQKVTYSDVRVSAVEWIRNNIPKEIR